MKILIVDDNADDRKFLRFNLEHHGCEVIEASDGREGLEMASKHRPDIIVSDGLMPEMDGFQFLRSLKTDDELKSIPFIFYSAVHVGYKEASLATSLGAEAFIIKPKDPQEFWEDLIGILEECKFKQASTLKAELIKEEEEFLKKYSHIIATKLEEKVRELEKAKNCAEVSEKRYRRLFDSTLDGVYRTDESNVFTMINLAGARIFGFESPESMVGTSVIDRWIDVKDRELFLEELKLKKSVSSWPVRAQKKDGEMIFLDISSNLVEDEHGKFTGIEGIIRDVTEHKRLENQLLQSQKMEAVGQLAGGIAHDFNNILSVIIGYGELIKMEMKDGDPFRENLDHMLEGADKAVNLTSSLLTFSRKQLIDLKPLNLNDIIKRMKKFLDRIIGADVQLKEELAEYPLVVMADSGQLEQALLNLSTNARDAMPQGGHLLIGSQMIELDEDFIRLHGFGKAGQYALLSVTDTGAGMDETTKKRIFEPFFTTKEVGKGTGLGLAMVYGIVKQHDGFVNFYSEVAKGTTFRIYLPLIRVEIKEGEQVVLPYPKGGTETILVAEDDDVLRKLAQTVLEAFGYRVITAVDGEDAISKFSEDKDNIKLCILDMIMPKKNGRDAYDEIKKINPSIKALFASGYTADIIQRKGLVEEGLDFVLKPLTPKDLLRKVREILDRKKF